MIKKSTVMVIVLCVMLMSAPAAGDGKEGGGVDGGVAIPLGACCFQAWPTQPYQCAETTQFDCTAVIGGTWMGAGTICVAGMCPTTGACCVYDLQSDPPTTCIQATPAGCAIAGGTYVGENVPCGFSACSICVKPPKNMAAWWGMDETSPVQQVHDATNVNHGTLWSSNATQPGFTFGVVGNALGLDGVDDFVKVPHSSSMDFQCGNFSMDAWVKRLNTTAGTMTILDRGPGLLSTGTGYHWFLDANAKPSFTIHPGFFFFSCTETSSGTVPFNQWTHLAVTSSVSGSTRTLKFYMNGVLTDTFTVGCVCLNDPGFMYIGSYQGGIYHWHGHLDEIELHKKELTAAEVGGVYSAGQYGKCKTRVSVSGNVLFCLNQTQATTVVSLCNYSAEAQSYNLSFQSFSTCGNPYSVPGPTIFTPLFTNPVNVPANQCVNVQVMMNRPAGFTAQGMNACFQVTATEIHSGMTFYGQTGLIDMRNSCVVPGPCCIDVEDLGVGTVAAMSFQVTNTSTEPLIGPYMLSAVDADDGSPSAWVGLNGLPPGVPVKGEMSIAPGEMVEIPFSAAYESHHALGGDHIVLSLESGTGAMAGVQTIAVHSKPVDTCPADFVPDGGEGVVGIADLLGVIGAWGPCPADENCPPDVDTSAFVGIGDLLAVIGGWGACN